MASRATLSLYESAKTKFEAVTVWSRKEIKDGVVEFSNITEDNQKWKLTRTTHKLVVTAGNDFNYRYTYYDLDKYDDESLTRNVEATGKWTFDAAKKLLKLSGHAAVRKVFMEAPYSREKPADEIHESKGACPCTLSASFEAAPFARLVKGHKKFHPLTNASIY